MSTKYYLSDSRSLSSGEYCLFGFANFTPVWMDGKYTVDAPLQAPPQPHFQLCLLFASASHLIVSAAPGVLPTHSLTWSLSQQGNPRKMEDAVSATRLRIRKQVEQAMNEVSEFFLPFSSFSLPSEHSQRLLTGFQAPHAAMGIKGRFLGTCSASLRV